MPHAEQPGLDTLALSRARVALGHIGHRHDVSMSMEGPTVVVTPSTPQGSQAIDRIVNTLRGDGINAIARDPNAEGRTVR